MQIVVIVAFILLLLVGSIGVFKGLSLKRVSNWLYGLSGVVGGLLLGIARADLSGGVLLGLLFGGLIMYCGTMVHLHRTRYEQSANDWMLLHGQQESVSALARIIERLRGKKS